MWVRSYPQKNAESAGQPSAFQRNLKEKGKDATKGRRRKRPIFSPPSSSSCATAGAYRVPREKIHSLFSESRGHRV